MFSFLNTKGKTLFPTYTLQLSSALGSDTPDVSLILPEGHSSHDAIEAAALGNDNEIVDIAIHYWQNTPLIWQQGVYDDTLTERCFLHISYKNGGFHKFKVSFPYTRFRCDAHTQYHRTAVALKNGTDVERFLAILSHFKGPFYPWQTTNHLNKTTEFKCGDTPEDILLMDRFSRSIRETCRGKIETPAPLYSVARGTRISNQDRTTIIQMPFFS